MSVRFEHGTSKSVWADIVTEDLYMRPIVEGDSENAQKIRYELPEEQAEKWVSLFAHRWRVGNVFSGWIVFEKKANPDLVGFVVLNAEATAGEATVTSFENKALWTPKYESQVETAIRAFALETIRRGYKLGEVPLRTIHGKNSYVLKL